MYTKKLQLTSFYRHEGIQQGTWGLPQVPYFIYGAACQNRTDDLVITNHSLCQLSQGGKYGKLSSLCPFQANRLNKDASLQIGGSGTSCAGFENNGRIRGGAFQA